jgi:hypothetical protein
MYCAQTFWPEAKPLRRSLATWKVFRNGIAGGDDRDSGRLRTATRKLWVLSRKITSRKLENFEIIAVDKRVVGRLEIDGFSGIGNQRAPGGVQQGNASFLPDQLK